MTTPMEKSGTGTLIAGTPKAFSIIAPPEECFPTEIDGKKQTFVSMTKARYLQN